MKSYHTQKYLLAKNIHRMKSKTQRFYSGQLIGLDHGRKPYVIQGLTKDLYGQHTPKPNPLIRIIYIMLN